MKILALASLIALSALSGSASAQMAPQQTAQMTAPHTMDGQVTKVDVKKGWVDIKTPEGRMKVHFPPAALADVKVGDSVTVELGMQKVSSAK
jgi:hypothetical protein